MTLLLLEVERNIWTQAFVFGTRECKNTYVRDAHENTKCKKQNKSDLTRVLHTRVQNMTRVQNKSDICL